MDDLEVLSVWTFIVYRNFQYIISYIIKYNIYRYTIITRNTSHRSRHYITFEIFTVIYLFEVYIEHWARIKYIEK